VHLTSIRSFRDKCLQAVKCTGIVNQAHNNENYKIHRDAKTSTKTSKLTLLKKTQKLTKKPKPTVVTQ